MRERERESLIKLSLPPGGDSVVARKSARFSAALSRRDIIISPVAIGEDAAKSVRVTSSANSEGSYELGRRERRGSG